MSAPELLSVQQPVTWQKRHPLRTEGEWENTNEHDAKWWANDANWWANNAKLWEIRPLYTHPAPAQQPLTVEVIADIAMQSGAYDDQLLAFARAIEAKHGIKEKP